MLLYCSRICKLNLSFIKLEIQKIEKSILVWFAWVNLSPVVYHVFSLARFNMQNSFLIHFRSPSYSSLTS